MESPPPISGQKPSWHAPDAKDGRARLPQARLMESPRLTRELARPAAFTTITATQSAAITMRERGEQHIERLAGIVEKNLPHIEAMEPGGILDHIEDVDRLD